MPLLRSSRSGQPTAYRQVVSASSARIYFMGLLRVSVRIRSCHLDLRGLQFVHGRYLSGHIYHVLAYRLRRMMAMALMMITSTSKTMMAAAVNSRNSVRGCRDQLKITVGSAV